MLKGWGYLEDGVRFCSRPALMKKLPRGAWLIVYCLLLGLAVWYGWKRGQEPHLTAEEACKRQCHPLPWQIKGEKRIPNASEGWRNYPTRPRCVCG